MVMHLITCCRRIPSIPLLTRHLSASSSTTESNDSLKVIYKWPLIRHFRFIARLKIYQTSVMVLSIPPLSYLYKVGAVTSVSLAGGCVAAGGAVMVLSVLSYAFSKIIGELQYCEVKPTVLHLSHLSFLGNKKTVLVNVEEIIPFGDLHQGNIVQKLEFGNRSFYYSLKYGNVTDSNTLKKILGITM